jgi:hypothetical protein
LSSQGCSRPDVLGSECALARVLTLLRRFPWLVLVVSFASGTLSFVLIRRGERLAYSIAALVLASWLWLLVEPLVRDRIEHRRVGAGHFVANFLSQSFHQEMLFFALPFFLTSTQGDLGQVTFTGLAIAAAALTTIDPAYREQVTSHPTGRMLFQAYCSAIAAVVVLPIVLHLPVEQALPVSLASIGAWLLITLPISLGTPRTLRQAVRWIGCALSAPLALWILRSQVPAAGIVVTEARITRSLDGLVPGEDVTTVRSETLADGVIAFAAIRAPIGLAQYVVFEWKHADYSERIFAQIHGGRESGFRTFARKYVFPADALGSWQVDIVTPQHQLLRRLHFDVRSDPASSAP